MRGNKEGAWRFVPREFQEGQQGWFELEFSLPPLIAKLVKRKWGDSVGVAEVKQRHFSFIDLTGRIGGIRRSVRLQLDRQWIDDYIREKASSGRSLRPTRASY